MKSSNFVLCSVAGILLSTLVGCATTIPPKIEVRDVESGRTYQTYKPWGKVEKGVGYSFVDIETGRHINLTNYEVKTLSDQMSVSPDSAEAKAFEAAKARGGVK